MSKFFISLLISVLSFFMINEALAKPNTDLPKIDQQEILENTGALTPAALQSAIAGYMKAAKKGEIENPDVLTVVDFSLPSTAKRLWVINLETSEPIMSLHTTHAKNTGVNYAKNFSNRVNSKKSSLGTYKTLNSYRGKYGYSLRLDGLEKGVNDNAFRRAIVVHPAKYASLDFLKRNKRLGRSWGCLALNPADTTKFVNATKNGSILYVYAPKSTSVA